MTESDAATFRVAVRDHGGDFGLYHEACGVMFLVTQNVSVETLTRLTREHECVIPPGRTES